MHFIHTKPNPNLPKPIRADCSFAVSLVALPALLAIPTASVERVGICSLEPNMLQRAVASRSPDRPPGLQQTSGKSITVITSRLFGKSRPRKLCISVSWIEVASREYLCGFIVCNSKHVRRTKTTVRVCGPMCARICKRKSKFTHVRNKREIFTVNSGMDGMSPGQDGTSSRRTNYQWRVLGAWWSAC